MKPSADTSLNWYFYILYSAFIWGYVVVRLLCGYSWDNILPVLIVWFLTCIGLSTQSNGWNWKMSIFAQRWRKPPARKRGTIYE